LTWPLKRGRSILCRSLFEARTEKLARTLNSHSSLDSQIVMIIGPYIPSQDSYVSNSGPLGGLGPSVLFGDSQTTPGPFYRAVQVDRSDLKMFHHFLSSLELRRPSSTNFCIMKAS